MLASFDLVLRFVGILVLALGFVAAVCLFADCAWCAWCDRRQAHHR
jgi:hypothetical protein